MAQPTLVDLYAKLGVQKAVYLDDYLASHGAFLVQCGKCGRNMVTTDKPRKRDLDYLRCADCIAAAEADCKAQRR